LLVSSVVTCLNRGMICNLGNEVISAATCAVHTKLKFPLKYRKGEGGEGWGWVVGRPVCGTY